MTTNNDMITVENPKMALALGRTYSRIVSITHRIGGLCPLITHRPFFIVWTYHKRKHFARFVALHFIIFIAQSTSFYNFKSFLHAIKSTLLPSTLSKYCVWKIESCILFLWALSAGLTTLPTNCKKKTLFGFLSYSDYGKIKNISLGELKVYKFALVWRSVKRDSLMEASHWSVLSLIALWGSNPRPSFL